MEILISSLVGGIIGLILGVVFEEPLTTIKKSLVKRVRIIFSRKRLVIQGPATFALGNLKTAWLVIDGNGELAYTPETIKCRVEINPITLPPEIQSLRTSIETCESMEKEKGQNYKWNGPLYALERYAIGRTVPDENLEVVFTFRPTDYFTFQATVASLDVNLSKPPATLTLRQKYLQNQDLSQPLPFLANGFGVVLVIITGDQKIILSRRQDSSGMRPGEVDVSVVEGLHPTLDRSIKQRTPDLYHAAIRGTQEELGIELVQDDITFLGFGVDVEYYQWNILGMARTSDTATQILERRKRGGGGKWELKTLEIIDSNPKVVLSYIQKEKIWSTAIVAIYWALVHEYGKKQVDKIAKEIFG